MSKLLKIVLLISYTIIFVQILRIIITDPYQEDIQINYMFPTPGRTKQLYREIRQNLRNANTTLAKMTFDFEKPLRLPTDLKFILKWTQAFSHFSSSIFKNGQAGFLDAGCVYYNCFMTNDKSLLIDLRNFDAILFDVENTWDSHPPLRAPHQKYIFTASESADNYPICDPHFDTYYNLTWTYKLDSDVRSTYLTILNTKSVVIGPNVNMNWINPMKPTSVDVKKRLKEKRKAAAWFVSHCRAKSGRENVTAVLVNALAKYDLTIDIFGWCGRLQCPRDRLGDCLDILEKDYYFYLAFENSLSEDYVTEKILYPLLHYTVPIVYGGANYSRFLPPGSYINAGQLDADTVAAKMNEAIKNKDVYYDYFRWHNHYIYREVPEVVDICTLCKILNQPKDQKVVNNFLQWWNSDHKKQCTGTSKYHIK